MKLVYSKFNRERLPAFQIETSIFHNNGNTLVRKKALTPSADDHIKQIYNNYSLLRSHNNWDIAQPNLAEGAIYTDYVQGSSYDKIAIGLFESSDKSLFKRCIQDYCAIVMKGSVKKKLFKPCDAFKALFKTDFILENVHCSIVSNLDMNLDNIIISNNSVIIIDYEWVFKFSVPVNYVIYRALKTFYYKHCHRLSVEMTLESLLDMADIDSSSAEIYKVMEISLFNYILGESRTYLISSAYEKQICRLEALVNGYNQFKEYKDRDVSCICDDKISTSSIKSEAACECVGGEDLVIDSKKRGTMFIVKQLNDAIIKKINKLTEMAKWF